MGDIVGFRTSARWAALPSKKTLDSKPATRATRLAQSVSTIGRPTATCAGIPVTTIADGTVRAPADPAPATTRNAAESAAATTAALTRPRDDELPTTPPVAPT